MVQETASDPDRVQLFFMSNFLNVAVSYKWRTQLAETVQISTKRDWLNNRRRQVFPGANCVAERLLCTAGDIALITQQRTPLSSILLFLHSHGSRMVVRIGEGLRKTLWSHGATMMITSSTASNKKTKGSWWMMAVTAKKRQILKLGRITHIFNPEAQKLHTITSTAPRWAPKISVISVSISVSPIQCEIWWQSTLLVPEFERWITARKVLYQNIMMSSGEVDLQILNVITSSFCPITHMYEFSSKLAWVLEFWLKNVFCEVAVTFISANSHQTAAPGISHSKAEILHSQLGGQTTPKHNISGHSHCQIRGAKGLKGG